MQFTLNLEIQKELRHIHAPAEKLYYLSKSNPHSILNQLPERGLAIVGTRSPTTRSAQFTRQIISQLKGQNLILISGFARGIDRIVHESALEMGIPTVAILGCGIDECYPTDHAQLKARLLNSNGIMISEYPENTPPLPHHFIHRNRFIAALSKAVLIIEAPKRSGTLNTANWAQQLERHIYVVPTFPGDSRMSGNQSLLDDGTSLCFWGLKNLGMSWNELASIPTDSNPNIKISIRGKELTVYRLVEQLFEENGSLHFMELQSHPSWKPDYFEIFEILLNKKLISERKSWISLNPTDV